MHRRTSSHAKGSIGSKYTLVSHEPNHSPKTCSSLNSQPRSSTFQLLIPGALQKYHPLNPAVSGYIARNTLASEKFAHRWSFFVVQILMGCASGEKFDNHVKNGYLPSSSQTTQAFAGICSHRLKALQRNRWTPIFKTAPAPAQRL